MLIIIIKESQLSEVAIKQPGVKKNQQYKTTSRHLSNVF